MTDEQIKQFTEIVLDNGARSAMRYALGESPAGYDKADKIAEGIALGIRNAFQKVGAATVPPDDEDGIWFQRAAFAAEGGTVILALWREDERRYILALDDNGAFVPVSKEDGHNLADLLETFTR